MTIRKKTTSGANEKNKASKKEVGTGSSSDTTTVETMEVVSSTSFVEEARQVMESESKSSVFEVTSASREVIMDSKGNIVKIIDTPPQTVGQTVSSHKSGKSSQDFIKAEQVQSVKQGRSMIEDGSRNKDLDVCSTSEKVSSCLESQSRSESRAESVQKSVSSSTSVEDRHQGHSSTKIVSNGTANGEQQVPQVKTSSKSMESRQSSKETYQATTKDGQTVSSTSRIHEAGEKVDDNGLVTASKTRNVENETSVTPSDQGRVKFTDDVRTVSDKVVLDSSSSESTAKNVSKIDVTRFGKPGQSAWDGTFIVESPSLIKEKQTTKVNKGKVDHLVSKAEVSERVSSSTMIHDSKIVVDESRADVSSTIHEQISSSSDKSGQKHVTSAEVHPKDSSRYNRPGDSTWDGTFVIEKTPEPKRRNVSDTSVFQHSGADNVIESTQRSDFREKSSDGSYEKKSSNMIHTVQGGTESSRFQSEERRDVTEEVYIDEKPTRRNARPGESSWNGEFVQEKPQKTSKDDTVVRRSEKRHDSVDVQDVTEEQNVSSTSESVSTSYVVEYASSDEKKKTEKVTSVSETILEEDSEGGIPRRQTPERLVRDKPAGNYRPGQSTWDGSFVREKPLTPDRRVTDVRRPTDTMIIRDVSEDNFINEAELSTSSYVVEHSSSQQSFTDLKDSSMSSAHEVYDVKLDNVPSRPETPKGRDTRLTKPGDSTWDGTFVVEKSSEIKRPPSRESDRPRPESRQSPLPSSRRHVSDTTMDLRDTRVSSSTEVLDKSFVVVEQSSHESYSDSSNMDYSTTSMETVIIRDGVPTSTRKTVTAEGPKGPEKSLEHRPQSVQKRPQSPEKSDRSARPSKPGASTWDGSFVYEKPTDISKKPSQQSPTDIKKPEGSTCFTEKSITLEDSSRDVQKTEFVASSTLERTIKDSEFSTTYLHEIDDKKGPVQPAKIPGRETSRSPTDKRVGDDKKDSYKVSTTIVREIDEKTSPTEVKDGKKSPGERPRSPEKWDRSSRPTKPGESTWDGSFVYEKPEDKKKKPTDDEKTLTKLSSKPKDDKPIGSTPRKDDTKVSIVKHEVTDVRDVKDDKTDIEVVQSSYVIDQSSSFTSMQDVRDVVEERVISEFTTDTREELRDVTKSTSEFIDKEQVTTSMVAQDVVDNARYDRFTSSTPLDTPRKSSPERPGYPRGIPGLREDDRTKPIPAAGKPSRPTKREPSPVETKKPSGTRPKSPEKPRDYVSPWSKPAAGKPSRQESAPIVEKPSKSEEKPRRGDQTPDSLDEDNVQPGKIPDILSKIPLKEQCICELCTCGRHRCPHNLPQDHLDLPRDEPIQAVTSYREEFDEKRIDRQTVYHHEDHLRLEGDFIGQRRTDYVATRGETVPVRRPQDNLKPEGEFIGRPKEEAPKYGDRAPVRKPQDNLRPEGEFDSTTTTELVFTGTPGERSTPIRRNTYTKVEGEFIDETTARSEYIDHRTVQRAEIIKRTDNLTVGEGEFTGTSHVKEDFHSYDNVERQPRQRVTYTDEDDRFYSKTDTMESTTTTQEEYRSFDRVDYRSTAVIRRDDNLKPEGPFEGVPHTKDDYVVPAITRRPEPQRPKDNLKPEGPFEGRPKDDFVPTRGERAEVKRPRDNLKPEGPFEGRPKDDYKPTRGERADVKRPEDNLRPEGPFEGRPKDDFSPKRAERPEVKKPQDNLKPEGPFEGRPKDDFSPKRAERPEVKRPEDNLKPEGLFEGRPKDDFKPTRGERADVKRPQDNLKPEGPFEGRPKDDYSPKRAERPEVKRPQDNLKPEGPFEGRPKDDFTPKTSERPEVKRPQDNLRPEGEFHDHPRAVYTPGERRTPIRHPDHLYPEGEFERPTLTPYGPGERASIVRHPDNLFPEGEFPDRERVPFAPAEKRTPIKHYDNLRPEGPFEGRPKDDYKPTRGERADVKRPEDNLKPEGPFEGRPKDDFSPKRAERPEVKRPQDNLYPEGEFERPEKPSVGPAERRTPIKHPDNLKPEGEFIGKPKDDFTPTKGDRAPVKRPEDNLKPEGPFEGRPKDDYHQPVRGERVEIVKHTDNLRMEGDIETYRSRDEYTDFLVRERAEVTRYKDNLRMEGEFTDVRTRDDFKVVRGERVDIVRHPDNLKPEGPFEGRPKDDYSPKRAERPEIKRPEDNLKPEGDFVRRPKEEAPKQGERVPIKKPKDNLRPEGEFEKPVKKPVGPAERRTPIKHADNLKPEGEFERPKPEEFRPAERPIVKKPQDNLKSEGEFIGRPKEETPTRGERADVKRPEDNLKPEGTFERPEKKPFGPAERRSPIKHPDNLKTEGEFERPKHEEYRPAERPEVKKPKDNLKPEGEFIGRPKEEAPRRGDRADVKRPKDNLYPEGEFEKPEPKTIGPAEKRTPIKHPDNLKPEGEFIGRPKEEAPKRGERADVKRPQDNLRQEGEFERPQKTPVKPAEKRTPIKHPDNLKPEGEFVGKPKDDYKPTRGERADVKRPEDNLKSEGPFEGRPKDDFVPVRGERVDIVKRTDNLRMEGNIETYRSRDEYTDFLVRERAEVTKYQDNLRMEGEFTDMRSRDDYKVVKGERTEVVRHPDNLKPEGPFEGRPKDDYSPKRAERPEIKRPEDNLRPEGEFERPEKKPVGPAERRSPIKHEDNLKPEGEFIGRPKEQAPKKGERADVKRPKDNLKSEGTFDRPEKKPVGPAERRSPIKHPDNLRPEGEFVGRPKEEAPTRGERADVTRPKDNLKPEGEFQRPQKSSVGPAERRTPIRHEDNLYPEGEFVARPKDDFTLKRAERPVQRKPKDNLKPEGEFTGKPKNDYKPTKGERTEIVIRKDNLKMEGDMDVRRSRDDYKTITKVERVDVVRREDNLKIEGEFVDVRRRDDYRVTRGERSEIVKHEDHLRPEGEFERPEKSPVGPAERRTPIKHPDNLKPEGQFAQRPKATTPTKGERAPVKKPKDNLKPEGEFERPQKSPSFGPAERRSPIKHPDNLHPEGEFTGRPRQETPTRGERADVKRPKDNLHPEGEFAKRTPQKVGPAERRTPIRHEDNLHPEGDFYMVPKDDYSPKRGERAPVRKPQDNLRPEGEMEVSPSSKDDYRHVNGERMEIRRHEDHLRMEGEMDVRRSRDDYKKVTKVERVDIKKREDNLKIEGEFIDIRRKDDYTHVVGERVPVKKHPDNLRPEGDFDRPQKSPQGPGERRSPIKHADNLKPEGDFIGRPRDDFVPKRGERAEVIRREDNLKMTGDFQDTTSQRSTYTVVRGERAEIKRHEDNLKVSTASMETKTTNRDTFAPTKKEESPAGRTVVGRKHHMESSITLGDDVSMVSTTNQKNFNTFTKRTAKEVAAKITSMESDTKRNVSATESRTLENGAVITTAKKITSAQAAERISSQNVQHHTQIDSRNNHQYTNEHHQRIHSSEHLRSQNITQTRRQLDDRSSIDVQSQRGQLMDNRHSEQYLKQLERQQQESSKRDYVNTQHMESRQTASRHKQQHEQHTISSQARYNSNQTSSAEFRQAIGGQSERSQLDSTLTKTSHHRKNVISSSAADVNNAVLHRRGVTSSTEALHTISSTAADQKKSISNLAESGQYISNSSQSNDRRSLTSLHRSNKEGNPWASSTYERPQRIVRQDNLTVGGKFYSHSEAKSYGNFSSQKVERVQRQSNVSHINLGDGSTVTSSMYKKEFVPRHKGPCPAALIEAKQAPFKHTRDTPKHKFYMPVVSN